MKDADTDRKLSGAEKRALLRIARESIEAELDGKKRPGPAGKGLLD